MGELGILLGIIIGAIVLVGGTLLGAAYIDYTIHDVPIEIRVDGDLKYAGRNACAVTSSNGNATKVKITGGFLCLFPKEEYVSKDVILTTKGG